MRRSLLLLGLAMWLGLGCNGWDDDSGYATRTAAMFFLAHDSLADLPTLVRYEADAYERSWNERVGISDADLSSATMRENHIWLSSGNQSRVIEVDPATDEVVQSFAGLPVRPHVFGVGRLYLLVGDTVEDRLAFVRLRSGSAVEVPFEGEAGRIIYNNERFYLQSGPAQLTVYDERALTPRFSVDFAHPILDHQFNRFNNIYVLTGRNDSTFNTIVSGPSDVVSAPESPVNYQKVRYTPWFDARYGSEYLSDLRLSGDQWTSENDPLLASITNFEADFFEGQAYLQRNDSLFRYDLHQRSTEAGMPFDLWLLRSWNWLGE